MKTRYYNDTDKRIDNYMWFKLLEQNEKLIIDYPGAVCFGSITSYGPIPKHTSIIDVYRDKNAVPYDDACVARYIHDLNELGFPVEIKVIPKDPKRFHFYVYTANYKSKTHLISTLTLLRMMWEGMMAKVVDYYFQMVDADPTGDKLDKLQAAHKVKNSYANGGHCVTWANNGANVDRDTLFANFQKGPGVFAATSYNTPLGLTTAWKGYDPGEKCPDCIYKKQHGIYA